LPQLGQWLNQDAMSYSRPAPEAWRAVGRCESPASRGWRMVLGPPEKPDAVGVRIDGEGTVFLAAPGAAESRLTAPFVRKAGQDNELTVLVLGEVVEVYVNGLAIRSAVTIPVATKTSMIRCAVRPDGSFTDVRSFAVAGAEGVEPLTERLADLR
jgi:hypothetical protein